MIHHDPMIYYMLESSFQRGVTSYRYQVYIRCAIYTDQAMSHLMMHIYVTSSTEG